MNIHIKLDRIFVNDEGDGSGNAEPYLWPFFFKIDRDILDVDLRPGAIVPYGQLPGFRAPGGRHGNLGGSVDAGDVIQVPAGLGGATFHMNVPTWLEDHARVGALVVLLEEDHAPSTATIEAAYTEMAQRVADALRAEVLAGLLQQSGDALSGPSAEARIAAELKAKLDHWLADVDDFIGVKLFTWPWRAFVALPFLPFATRWHSGNGSEDGDFTLVGHVKAEQRPERVIIYEHAFFNGAHKELAPGEYRLDRLGLRNDTLSSVRVPTGWTAALYQHGAFNGDARVLTGDTATLDAAFDNQTSSIAIADGPRAIIYRHADFRGTAQMLRPGRYTATDLRIGNDQLTSLTVPEGWRVTLFQHADFSGMQRTYTQDARHVGGDFNDRTSAILVED